MSRWLPLLAQAWVVDEPRRLSAQMELLDRNLPMALVSSGLMAVLGASAYWLSTGDGAVGWWAVLAVMVSGVGYAIRGALPSPSDLGQVQTYLRFARLIVLLLGVAWGLFVWWFMKPQAPITVTILMGLTAGMSAGGVGGFCAQLARFGALWFVVLVAGDRRVVAGRWGRESRVGAGFGDLSGCHGFVLVPGGRGDFALHRLAV